MYDFIYVYIHRERKRKEEKERRLWRSGNKLETGARNGLFTIGPRIHERYSTSLINENMPMKTTDTVFPYQMDYKYK